MQFKKIKYYLSVFCVIAGLTLMFICVFIPPTGEIHSSVLVAFGEVLTFAGSVLGIYFHANDKTDP